MVYEIPTVTRQVQDIPNEDTMDVLSLLYWRPGQWALELKFQVWQRMFSAARRWHLLGTNIELALKLLIYDIEYLKIIIRKFHFSISHFMGAQQRVVAAQFYHFSYQIM